MTGFARRRARRRPPPDGGGEERPEDELGAVGERRLRRPRGRRPAVPRSSLTRIVRSGFWKSSMASSAALRSGRADRRPPGPVSGRMSATLTEPVPIRVAAGPARARRCRRRGRRSASRGVDAAAAPSRPPTQAATRRPAGRRATQAGRQPAATRPRRAVAAQGLVVGRSARPSARCDKSWPEK